MKIKYKYRLVSCFFLLFVAFGAVVIIAQRREDQKERITSLESRLDGYAYILNNIIVSNHFQLNDMADLNRFGQIFPDSIRITIIDNDGVVRYDNIVDDVKTLSNHIDRPEVRSAIYKDTGFDIRKSSSIHVPYLYFVRHFKNYYIRVALPFNVQTKNILSTDNSFVILVIILMLAMLIVLYLISTRLSRSIRKLKYLADDIRHDRQIKKDIKFPNDELGDIAADLLSILDEKQQNNQKLMSEREKLITHFKHSNNGLAIFDEERNLVYANAHFYQLVNFITNDISFDLTDLLKEDSMKEISAFLDKKEEGMCETHLDINGKFLEVKVNLFADNNFEIVIHDETEPEKNHILKQEITSNIAHELKTPVTSIRGYLEILNDNGDKLDPDRRHSFTEKAYLQSIRLSQLINDVSLLSKMDSGQEQFAFQDIDLMSMLDSCRIELTDRLEEKKIEVQLDFDKQYTLRGNYVLLHSVFFNLMENTIKYAGGDVLIHIEVSKQDDKNIYITYYDTGVGVDEKHLARLFERFYRVSEGRTREDGGSGLGLSIVMNAIKVHNGDIQVKNHAGGGLEYLMRFPK